MSAWSAAHDTNIIANVATLGIYGTIQQGTTNALDYSEGRIGTDEYNERMGDLLGQEIGGFGLMKLGGAKAKVASESADGLKTVARGLKSAVAQRLKSVAGDFVEGYRANSRGNNFTIGGLQNGLEGVEGGIRNVLSKENTALVKAIDAPNGLRKLAMDVHDLAGNSPIAKQRSAVAIAEVELATGERTFYASGSGGRLNPAQRNLLQKYSVPEENILSGAKYTKGYSQLENHAERVIERNIPVGASAKRWGISWTTPQKPIPCSSCSPFVKDAGGALELGGRQ